MYRKDYNALLGSFFGLILFIAIFLDLPFEKGNNLRGLYIDICFLTSTYFFYMWLKRLPIFIALILITIVINIRFISWTAGVENITEIPTYINSVKYLGIVSGILCVISMMEFKQIKFIMQKVELSPWVTLISIIGFTVFFQLVTITINWV
jgi:hypothetical protein